MKRLENKVAIVTGGASNPGLGHATIHRFAEEGAKLVVTDIDVEGGKKTVEEIKEKGAEAIILGCTEIPIGIPERKIDNIFCIDTSLVLARALINEFRPEKPIPWSWKK